MSLLKLRDRLKTVKSLNSVFSALQVVTMVRTRKVKEKHFAMERYLSPIRETLRGRVKSEQLGGKTLVVVTSNRGLCGMFNKMVLAKANDFLRENPAAQLVALGKNGAEYYRRLRRPPRFQNYDSVEKPAFESTKKIFRQLFELRGEIHVAYNIYHSTVSQVPKIERLYPLPEELAGAGEPPDLIMEPDPLTLVDRLYYHYLEARLFQIILNSVMGELGARFMVLKGAVDTSQDMADGLLLSINKARQMMITRDLLEIVSAAEALRSDYE